MVLYYDNYQRLLKAIKKYAEERNIRHLVETPEIQSAIYKHFIGKYGSFVAENGVGEKVLFIGMKAEERKRRKSFRVFMKKTEPTKYLDSDVSRGKSKDSKKNKRETEKEN
jgi:predicted ATP-grasp superfamily ATP-dependent carboligase